MGYSKFNDRSKNNLVDLRALADERSQDRAFHKRQNGWPMKCPKCGGPNIYECFRRLQFKWACGCGHTWSKRDANSGAAGRPTRKRT